MSTAYKQQGMALLIGMIFLALMGIVGVQVAKQNHMRRAVSNNRVQYTIAFETAERGLADAEDIIAKSKEMVTSTDNADIAAYKLHQLPDDWHESVAYVGTEGYSSAIGVLGRFVSGGDHGIYNIDIGASQFYGCQTSTCKEPTMYEVVAVGAGANPQIKRSLETVYAIQY